MRVVTIGPHRLYHGDSAAVLPLLAGLKAAVVADPPYGMGWDSDSTRLTGGKMKPGDGRRDWAAIVGDDAPFDPAPWLCFPEVILWGSNHFSDRLPPGGQLIWLKRAAKHYGTFLSDAEVAWQKGSSGVFCYYHQFPPSARSAEAGRSDNRPVHPTQKPIGLMEWCIGFTAAPIVFDPFMGSGTCGVAAVRAGRRYVGVELQQGYFDVACERVERAFRAPGLFGGGAGDDATGEGSK